MSTATRLITASEFVHMAEEGFRLELIAGELHRMSPAGNEHGRIAMNLGGQLFPFVKEHALGAVYAAETGFILSRNPDTVRAPDLAFITRKRLDETGNVSGYWPGAPDLAAEVVSPSDTYSEVANKALAWLEAGTQLVWIVDPVRKNVTVYRSSEDIRVLDAEGTLDAPDLIPGWQIAVVTLFD